MAGWNVSLQISTFNSGFLIETYSDIVEPNLFVGSVPKPQNHVSLSVEVILQLEVSFQLRLRLLKSIDV